MLDTVTITAAQVKRGEMPVTIDGTDVRRYVITRVTEDAGWIWLTLRSPIGGDGLDYPGKSFRLTPSEELTVLRKA